MVVFFFFKQKTAYEMRISDWISDVCSSDLTGSINLKGARIDDIVLPTYNQTIKKDSPPVRLFSPSGTKDSYFGGFGWTGDGLKAPDANTVWAARGDKLTPSTPVTLRWNNGQGQIFEIKRSEEHTSELQSLMRISYAVFCLNTKTQTA